MNPEKIRILIIDDDQNLGKTLADILRVKGYETITARDGREGLALLEEHAVNLALVDLGLPDIPGLEVMNRIKSGYPATEVIILTGNATLDSAIEATNLGAFYYLLKPYEIGQLLLHVRRAIEKQQVRDELARKHEELEQCTEYLAQAYSELKTNQLQMLQREKMASIGQLAMGVAHEINNPLGFIYSNLSTLSKYIARMVDFINAQSDALNFPMASEKITELEKRRQRIKLDYIIQDATQLIGESLAGAERVKKIVQDLNSFSQLDDTKRSCADINECLDSSINIAWSKIKHVAALNKEYGDIPPLLCYPQQLSQLFINLLVNAAHAVEERGEITVRTWCDAEFVFIAISDTGNGIPDGIKNRIFEPFFTTRDVGKGIGLGLSISYDIVKKHGGEIVVDSEVGKGTTFTVKLPVAAV
jgi:signal transduction histidine kinase